MVSAPTRAVFLSYASEDSEAAARIAQALKSAGVEVWFDKSELRGGDAWDQQIRRQVHDCRLFMPLVSAHTEARGEGYFRREWRLAVDRTHDLSERMAFLTPVAIDSTSELKADVPEAFRRIQWMRLPGGEPSAAFIEQVRRLLSPGAPAVSTAAPVAAASGVWQRIKRHKVAEWTLAYVAAGYALLHGVEIVGHAFEWPSVVPRFTIYGILVGAPVAVALAWYHGQRGEHRVSRTELGILAALLLTAGSVLWVISRSGSPPTRPTVQAAFSPPAHSIAVLPFVNMSGDPKQEYFSDGLTEELLDSLARVNELQVAARTSAFSFKGKDTDIGTIARKLNVGAILEGSVRRSGNTIRVTAQLNSTLTGFHLWSETYDRDLGDILKLQTEIARAVAAALKVRLLGDVVATIEVGGTRNPDAFDAYLQATHAFVAWHSEGDLQTAISHYTEAIRLDPNYALAYADRSLAYRYAVREFANSPAVRGYADRALADAHKAIALAADLGKGHLALAYLLADSLELGPASEEYERARALAPGDARLLRYYGLFAVQMGRIEAGLAASRRAVALDPLSFNNYGFLGISLAVARHYTEAVAALKDAIALAPEARAIKEWMGWAYYRSGDLESARATCESAGADGQICLAMVYEKLGRHADAQAALLKDQALQGNVSAVWYAAVYADWGDRARALDWLEVAMRERSPYLPFIRALQTFDPLQNEPRLQAIERTLKFPDSPKP